MLGLAPLLGLVALAPQAAPVEDPLTWWSLRPIVRPATPAGANPIDAFVAARLAAHGLVMAPEADARTLCRRLYFDLVGLPPTPAAIDAFAEDPTPDKYARLVDGLLASPRHGERWARHWLDVVHYGDTHGYDKDQPRPHAWPYRDYVIRAFNEDKPYARFVQEQIAGDALYPATRDGNEALGFLAAGPWDLIGHEELPEDKIDGKIARHFDRDDMVGNALGTFCSVTVQCAQCHDHKFDPVPQEDYYSLQAVFAALDRADRAYDVDAEVAARRTRLLATRTRLAEELRALDASPTAAGGEEVAAAGRALASAEAATRAARARIDAALTQAAQDLAALPAQQVVYAGTVYHGTGNFCGTGATGGKPREIRVLARGQVTRPGRRVAPAALTALDSLLPSRFELADTAGEAERRQALARWIVDVRNPLTWRSIVNRVWQYHFGRGLVETANDFGRMGGQPTHPELLDWLAAAFRDEMGGSLKSLHRLIVTSAAYRQRSAVSNRTAQDIDGSNSLLWRANVRKLEAEAVRDAVLMTSGSLDLSMGGPGWQDFVIEHPEHSPHYRYDLADPDDPRTFRRAVYRFIVRSQTQPFLTALDCADPSMRVDRRNVGVSPNQALAYLNNGFMLAQAARFATRVEREAGAAVEAQIERAVRIALGRAPAATERRQIVDYALRHGLASACRLILNLNEFSFID